MRQRTGWPYIMLVLMTIVGTVLACTSEGMPGGEQINPGAVEKSEDRDQPQSADGQQGKPVMDSSVKAPTEDDSAMTRPAESDDFFARSAFPPVMPDTEFHQDAWERGDCRLCHVWGVYEAPHIRHEGMPKVLLAARCRTCHLLIRGGNSDSETGETFARNAFPPTLPDDKDHQNPWAQKECLDCHQSGKDGAMLVRHDGMSKVLLTARCRTCHVLVRNPESASELEQ